MPLGLPAFLDTIRFNGPIYNTQNLGGFYSFHGHPDRIPFLDGRFEAYDPQTLYNLIDTTFNAYRNPEPWHALEKQFGFQGLLLENGAGDSIGLLPLIAKEDRWKLVYLDYAASFWLRADLPDLPPEVDLTAVTALVDNVANFSQAENLDSFLEKSARYQMQRFRLLEQAEKRWQSADFTKKLGLLQMDMGRFEAAETTFKRLLARHPESLQTMMTLSQIALLRGDRITAEHYLIKGLELFPDDADLRDNLAELRQTGTKRTEGNP
jgi:tetratricopeptide (TPR) repeat protein